MPAITEFKGAYRYLSNFWEVPVVLDGETYPSIENAYQSAKTLDLTARKPFATMSAKEAKAAGKKAQLRQDWESVKIQYMKFLVWQKFSVHRELQAKLLLTGDSELVEGNTWGDTFWGVCGGQGENHLGKILMEVREELKKSAPVDKVFTMGPNMIFVFGSNLSGIHGGGAAKTALDNYGAIWGQGEGLQGNSYALPTKDQNLKTLPIDHVKAYVLRFLAYAEQRPDLYFFVTRIGCGLAGFTDAEIGPMFKGAPENCELPHGWGV